MRLVELHVVFKAGQWHIKRPFADNMRMELVQKHHRCLVLGCKVCIRSVPPSNDETKLSIMKHLSLSVRSRVSREMSRLCSEAF